MVNGMANRETSGLGGGGVVVYLKGLISWVLTPARKRKEKKKNYAGSENHSPHQLRKKSRFGAEYRKAPPPRKGRKNQWGSRGLQAWPEITGS
jgi:hypothetical protein